MIFTEVYQLDGVSYYISTAENDGIVWNDREYWFRDLPSYLVGALLFQVPHKVSKGTVIKITVQTPSTIYIAHEEGNRSGGFENSLTNSGWTLENDNAEFKYKGQKTFKYVWKMFVSANGPTTITLPGTTTEETTISIFVRGNSFKITLN